MAAAGLSAEKRNRPPLLRDAERVNGCSIVNSEQNRGPAMNAVRCLLVSLLAVVAVFAATHADAATLYVGAVSCDITPDQPVFLSGQFNARVSRGVSCPMTANILALESRDGDKVLEQAIVISMDTVVIREPFLNGLQGGDDQGLARGRFQQSDHRGDAYPLCTLPDGWPVRVGRSERHAAVEIQCLCRGEDGGRRRRGVEESPAGEVLLRPRARGGCVQSPGGLRRTARP